MVGYKQAFEMSIIGPTVRATPLSMNINFQGTVALELHGRRACAVRPSSVNRFDGFFVTRRPVVNCPCLASENNMKQALVSNLSPNPSRKVAAEPPHRSSAAGGLFVSYDPFFEGCDSDK